MGIINRNNSCFFILLPIIAFFVMFLTIIFNYAFLTLVILVIFFNFAKKQKIFLRPLDKRGYFGIFVTISFICIFLYIYLSDYYFTIVFFKFNLYHLIIYFSFIPIFALILWENLWKRLDYIIDKKIKIGFLKNYRLESVNCIVDFLKEKDTNNIYCYNKKISERSGKFLICVIREIDNQTTNADFMQDLYENYYNDGYFSYENFIEFANKNDMFLRTYDLSKPLHNNKKHLNILMKENGILIEPKKLNINEASVQEITNLPFINIVTAKRIIKHIEEQDEFKSFWEFARFLKLKENQGKILSKLVFVKPITDKEEENEEESWEIFGDLENKVTDINKRDLDL